MKRDRDASTQIWALSAATGKALTTVLAGFAFTFVVASVAKLSRRPAHTFVFISCCSASVLTRAPLVITLLVDFMAFIAFMLFMGAMIVRAMGERGLHCQSL